MEGEGLLVTDRLEERIDKGDASSEVCVLVTIEVDVSVDASNSCTVSVCGEEDFIISRCVDEKELTTQKKFAKSLSTLVVCVVRCVLPVRSKYQYFSNINFSWDTASPKTILTNLVP